MTGSDEATMKARGDLLRLTLGGMAAQVVGAAARLDVADKLGDRKATAIELAERLELPHQPTLRLLRALAGLGLCVERPAGTFALTAVGELLRTDRPDSVNSFTRMFTDPVMLKSWSQLEFSLRTGKTAFDEVFGVPFFEHLSDDHEMSALFNASMSQGTRGVAAVLPGQYDFGRFESVLDIGGGDGTLLAAILGAHSGLRGSVLESAEGGAGVVDTLAESNVSDRGDLIVGDFFTTIPAGADLHLLKSIVHDWDDDRVVTILGHSRAALPAHGRLLIVEPILPDTVPEEGPGGIYLSDLNMLVNVGGRERTRDEFAELLTRSGFAMVDAEPLPPHTGMHLIEGAPA